MAYLRNFRRSHEQLRTITGRSLGGLEAPFDIDMTEEVRLSYESVKNVDVLDVSSGASHLS